MTLHPFLNPDETEQKDAWNSRYRTKGKQWGNAPYSDFPEDGSEIILELGVGDGKNLRCRKVSDARYIGLDFSTEAIRICRGETALSGVIFLIGDACSLPFRNGSIPRVYAHHILGHNRYESEIRIMSEVFRVLSPGGQLILTVFATGDMRDGTGTETEQSTYLRGDGIMTRYYTEEMILQRVTDYQVKELKRIEWPMRIRGREWRRAEIFAILEKSG